MINKKELGIIISLSGFSIVVNTLPSLVTWFSSSLNISFSIFSLVFAFQYASFTIFSVIIGKLSSSKHLNLPLILLVALFISSITIGLIGYAWSFIALIVSMIVVGGAGGSVESIGTTLLAHESQNKNFIYFSQFFYALGAFVAPLIISILLSKDTAIPSITLIVGAFSVVIGLLVAFLLFGNKSKINRSKPTEEIPSSKIVRTSVQPKGVFAGIFLAMIFYVIIESSISSWLPSYFESSLDFNPSQASALLSSYWAGLMVARLWYSFYQKKGIQPFLIAHGIVMLLSVLVLFLFRIQHSYLLIITSCFVIGVGCGPIWPLLIEYCSKLFDQQHYIMYLVAGGSFGALIGPSLTALIFDQIGMELFLLIIFFYALILLSLIMAGHSKRASQ